MRTTALLFATVFALTTWSTAASALSYTLTTDENAFFTGKGLDFGSSIPGSERTFSVWQHVEQSITLDAGDFTFLPTNTFRFQLDVSAPFVINSMAVYSSAPVSIDFCDVNRNCLGGVPVDGFFGVRILGPGGGTGGVFRTVSGDIASIDRIVVGYSDVVAAVPEPSAALLFVVAIPIVAARVRHCGTRSL